MCRSCSDGGRRCPKSAATKAAEREASKRYYQRTKARARIAALNRMGLSAMDDLDCPKTYHMGFPLTDRASIERGLTRTGDAGGKPGGLWCAPGRTDADGRIKTQWSDWSVSEDFHPEALRTASLTEIKPTPGAVVLRVDTPADIVALGDRFFSDCTEVDGLIDSRKYDEAWTSIREQLDVDGVYVTQSAVNTAGRMVMLERSEPGLLKPGTQALAERLPLWFIGSATWFKADHLEAIPALLGSYPKSTDDSGGPWAPTYELDNYAPTWNEGRATVPRSRKGV